MKTSLQLVRKTAFQWLTENSILEKDEIGVEIETSRIKIGDGITPFFGLKFQNESRPVVFDSLPILTPNVSLNDSFEVKAQAEAIVIDNPTGILPNFDGFIIRLTDNGVSRAITYGNKYRAFGSALPLTTTIGKTIYLICIYNSTDNVYDTASREEV